MYFLLTNFFWINPNVKSRCWAFLDDVFLVSDPLVAEPVAHLGHRDPAFSRQFILETDRKIETKHDKLWPIVDEI
jgi:hypothetical protein